MRIKKRLLLVLSLSLAFVFMLPLGGFVNATTWVGGSGSGVSSGSGDSVDCNTYLNALSTWCVGTDDGGASWHIYSINSLPDDPSGPIYESRGKKNFLSGSGYSKADLVSRCPSDTYKYYLAYVFDGRVDDRRYFAQWGPIAPNYTFVNGSRVQENQLLTDGLAYTGSYVKLLSDMESGADINGKRVGKDIATRLYQDFTGSNGEIPPSTGYFCVKEVNDTRILGKSFVSLRDSDTSTGELDWETSGENAVGDVIKVGSVTNQNVDLCKGDEAYLTFTHAVMSNSENAKATASVTVNLEESGPGTPPTIVEAGGFPLSAGGGGRPPVEVMVGGNENGLQGKYYELYEDGGTKKYTDGSKDYFYRDHLKIRFNQSGEYMLCETLSIDGYEVTKVCADVVVTNDCEDLGECGKIDINVSPYLNSNKNEGETMVASKVRNNSVESQKTWSDQVYAKPDDNPEWLHCYYPGVQWTANAEVTDNHRPGDYEGAREQDCTDASCSFGGGNSSYSLTKKKLSSGVFGTWQNQYTISTSSPSGSDFVTPEVPGSTTKSSPIGIAAVLSFEDASYQIPRLRVGDTLVETNTSGIPVEVGWQEEDAHQWDCRYAANGVTDTCRHQEKFISHYRIDGPVSDSASVLIPYNFRNTTEITTDTDTPVFAGETKEFDIKVSTLKKQNNVTGGEYATIVRGAKLKLQLCYTDIGGRSHCSYGSEKPAGEGGILNPAGSPEGDEKTVKLTASIPDLPAGSEVCLFSKVYPGDSGGDTNLDPSGNRDWSPNSKSCYTVAKKPSLEIWGGNVYSNGLIRTSTAEKNNLAYYEDMSYHIDKTSPVRRFGSWTDSGIIANGGVSEFSSGATLGGLFADSRYPNPQADINNNNPLVDNPGGGDNTALFCNKRSPLTFSNSNCGTIGSIGGDDLVTGAIQSDRDAIILKYVSNVEDNIITETVSLNDLSQAHSYNEDDAYLFYGGDNNLTVNGYEINDSNIRVVYSKGDVTIGGDLKYAGAYATYDKLPKLVIYAGGDINIKCSVNRIDGLLIASEKVSTCSDADAYNQNEQKRANQLIVNGAIISNSLDAGRTYGAGIGANSIVPAEIISFDPSLHLWVSGSKSTTGGGSGPTVGGSKALKVTYQKELAPRL